MNIKNYRKETISLLEKQQKKLKNIILYNENFTKSQQAEAEKLFKLVKILQALGNAKEDYKIILNGLKTAIKVLDHTKMGETVKKEYNSINKAMNIYKNALKTEALLKAKLTNNKSKKSLREREDDYVQAVELTQFYKKIMDNRFSKSFADQAKDMEINTKEDYGKYVSLLVNGSLVEEGESYYLMLALILKWGINSDIYNYDQGNLKHKASKFGYNSDPLNIYTTDKNKSANGVSIFRKVTSEEGVYKTNPTDLPTENEYKGDIINIDDKNKHDVNRAKKDLEEFILLDNTLKETLNR